MKTASALPFPSLPFCVAWLGGDGSRCRSKEMHTCPFIFLHIEKQVKGVVYVWCVKVFERPSVRVAECLCGGKAATTAGSTPERCSCGLPRPPRTLRWLLPFLIERGVALRGMQRRLVSAVSLYSSSDRFSTAVHPLCHRGLLCLAWPATVDCSNTAC